MAGRLAGRFLGLGITGSIAAFKAVDLLRLPAPRAPKSRSS